MLAARGWAALVHLAFEPAGAAPSADAGRRHAAPGDVHHLRRARPPRARSGARVCLANEKGRPVARTPLLA